MHLPQQINRIDVSANQTDLGLLTRGSAHHFQPTQLGRYASLTIINKSLNGFTSDAIHPIFAQNLPEGVNRRFIEKKRVRNAKVDDMYLLALQGNQGVGMLNYRSDLNVPDIEPIELSDILTYHGKESLVMQLLEKYYLKSVLSGMQPKVNIPNSQYSHFQYSHRTDQMEYQPDLIVKSFEAEFPLLTVNEFVCMGAAKACGLAPPPTYLSENLQTYVIERFDRDSSGVKLGFEDFTTLLKKSNAPDAKYSGSYESLLKATQVYTQSYLEYEKMYKYIVFSCLIGNGDAHLKNFALQYTPDMKAVFLSPPFDITHTLIYDSIDHQMALNMNNSKAFPSLEQLVKLADIGNGNFKIHQPKRIVEAMAEQIYSFLATSQEVLLIKGLRGSIEKSVSDIMSKH